jgi:monofunctional biosynthetic peptidoglycan transglycosylase
VGGSTITQQLAKNLFLSGERTSLRKAQELVLTLMLESLLSKQRILEIYLNNVEWGEGVFGAQAAARHYFRVDAAGWAPSRRPGWP